MTEGSIQTCIACGWTAEQQKECSYSSHVKLFYGASRRGTWAIGSDVIMKERPDEGPKTEVTTLNFLASHHENKIPAPKVIRDWVDSDGQYFVLLERIKGQTLEQAWTSLSESQKIAIADQVLDARQQLRSITSLSMQSVDNTPCYPGLLFFDLEPHGPFNSDLELWNALVPTLPDLPHRVLEGLKRSMPKCEPYVLTHCDLNLGNIIFQNGKLVGILDWEYAAYYPVWWEYVSASWGWTEQDSEWKGLLRERFALYGGAHEDAKQFWVNLRHLRKYPNLDEKGREVLEMWSSN